MERANKASNSEDSCKRVHENREREQPSEHALSSAHGTKSTILDSTILTKIYNRISRGKSLGAAQLLRFTLPPYEI